MEEENKERDPFVFEDIREEELCEDSDLRKYLEDISLYRVHEDGTREYKILVIDNVEVKGKRKTVSYVSAFGASDLIREAKRSRTEHELEDRLSEWIERLCESPMVEKSVVEPYQDRLQKALKDRGDIVLFVGKEHKGPIGLIRLDELTDKWDFGRKKQSLMSHLEDVLTRMSNLYKHYIEKQEEASGGLRIEVEDKEIEQGEPTEKYIALREKADVVAMGHKHSNVKKAVGYLSLAIALAVPVISYFKIPLFKSKLNGVYSSVKQGIEERISREEVGLLTEDEKITTLETEELFESELKRIISEPEKSVIDPHFKDKIDSECKLLVFCGNLCSDYPQVEKYRNRAIKLIIRFEDIKNSPEYKKLSEKRKEDIETLILNVKQACKIPF